MQASEVVAFVAELESLGVKFTVVPRLDGSLRLSCWRFPEAASHRERINRLLAATVDSSPANAAQIAEFIHKRAAAAEQSSSPSGR
jgi:hypothetical protein